MKLNLMQRAIDEAEKFQTPFGAVLYNGSRLIAAANTVKKDGKVYHAEMNAFLKMPSSFKQDNHPLELFSTCEPCPMCMGAAIWSGVDRIYFGVSIDTASKYLSQIHIDSNEIASKSFRSIEVIGDQMHAECLELFERYKK